MAGTAMPTSNDTQIASGKITNDNKKDVKIDIIDNLYHDHMIRIPMALCFFHAAMWIPQIRLNVPQCCSSNFLPKYPLFKTANTLSNDIIYLPTASYMS
ncbi:MAG: hypothetical protein GY938_12420 [Ketobacter sp.]|nr:hypothetical protein [Ketobacter sp.]